MSLGSIGENSYFADPLDDFQSMLNSSSLDFDDQNNNLDINNNVDSFIDEETAEKEYVTQSQLYLDAMKSITQLKQRLIRRTSIIDEIRKYYLRDIVTVKELINQVLTTDERKSFLSLYDQNLPSLDMTQSLLLHSPNKCEMVVKHCSECGGHVEIIMKDSIEVERLKKIISDSKDREGRFRIKLGELDAQIETTSRDKSEALKRYTEEKKYLYSEMKKLRTQHEQLQEEMDVHSKAHKKLQAENKGYKSKLNSLIHASELLEQADVAKEIIKAELAETNSTIKQMKANEKNIHKELTMKKTQIQELNQVIDVSKEESRVLKNDKDTLHTQIEKLNHTNKDLNSQLIDLNQKESNATNRIKSLEDTLDKLKKIQHIYYRTENLHTSSSPSKGSDQGDSSSNRKHKRRSSQRKPSDAIVTPTEVDIVKVQLPNSVESVEVVSSDVEINSSAVLSPQNITTEVPIIVLTTEVDSSKEVLPNNLEEHIVMTTEEIVSNIVAPIEVIADVNSSTEVLLDVLEPTEVISDVVEVANDSINTESNERVIVVESTINNESVEKVVEQTVSEVENDEEFEDYATDDDEYDEDDTMQTEEEIAEEQKRKEILKIAEEIYEKRKNAVNSNTTTTTDAIEDKHALNVGGYDKNVDNTINSTTSLDQSSQCEFIMSNTTTTTSSACQTDVSGAISVQPSQTSNPQQQSSSSTVLEIGCTTDNDTNKNSNELSAYCIGNIPPSSSPSATAPMIKRRKSLPRTMSIRQLTLRTLNDGIAEESLVDSSPNHDDDLQPNSSDINYNNKHNSTSKEKELLLRLEQLKKEFEQGVYRPGLTIKNDDGTTTTTTAAELVYIPVPVITIEKHVNIIHKPPKLKALDPPAIVSVSIPEVVVAPKKESRKTIITDPVVSLDDVAEDASEYELLLRTAMEQALKDYPNIKLFEINKYLNAVNKTIHQFCAMFDKSLDATWTSLLSNRSNLDSLTRMNVILDGMVTSADPKIDRAKFESLYKKISPYTEMQIIPKVTASWKDEVRISDEMIFELNPRIDEFTGKSILKRYEEYYNGSLKTDLNDKVNNTLDTIKKMSKFTDRATNKLIKYLPDLIKDWQKLKLEYFGINNKVAHEVEIVRKGLESKLQTYQRELEVVNKDNKQHFLEIEKLNTRIKELLIKEIDLHNAKIAIEENMFVIEGKTAQITDLVDDFDRSKQLSIEKDERMCELEKIIGNADDNIIKLNENIQDNIIEIQNLKNTLFKMTKEKDSFKSEYDNMIKKEAVRLHGLVSTYMQVEPYVNDQAIQTEFVAPPMNLRTMIAGKHLNTMNARGKQRSTQVFSQSLDAASHSIDSFHTNNSMFPQVDNLFGDLVCEGSMYSSNSVLQNSVDTDRTRKLGYSKVIHVQQASTPLTPLIFKHSALNSNIPPPQSHFKDSAISKAFNNHNNTLNFSNSVARSIGSATITDGLVGNSLNKPRNYHPTSTSVYSIDSYYGTDINDTSSLASSNKLKVGFADDATPNTKSNFRSNKLQSFKSSDHKSNSTTASTGSFQYVHNEQKVPQKYLIDQYSSNFALGTSNNSSYNHHIALENVVDSSQLPYHRRTEVDVGLPEVIILSYAQQIKQQQQNQSDQSMKTTNSFINTSSTSENKLQRSDSFNLDSPRGGNTNNTSYNLSIRYQLEKDNILSKNDLQPGYDLINGIVYNNKGFKDPSSAVTNNNRNSSGSPNSTGSASVTSSSYVIGSGIHMDYNALNNSNTKLHFRNNDSNIHDNNKSNSRAINVLNVIDPQTTTNKGSSSSNNNTNKSKSNHNISDEMLRRLRKELVSR